MGGKGFNHLTNVGVETGNSEIICIGIGEKVVGTGGNVEVKKLKRVRGYTSALRGPYSSMKEEGEGKVIPGQLAERPFD